MIEETKDDIEKRKLLLEIKILENDLKEKRQSWVRKNLSILIPSIIGIATLLTGVFTGFFDAEKVNIENRRHDLVEDTIKFSNKKDSILKENSKLIALNNNYVNQNKYLASQTTLLKDSNKHLFNYLGKLTAQRIRLSSQKATLLSKVSDLKLNFNTAGFNLLWSRFKVTKDLLTLSFVLDTIKKATFYKRRYVSILKIYADTVKDLGLKGMVDYVELSATSEDTWKREFFHTGEEIIHDMVKKATYIPPPTYWTFWGLFDPNYSQDAFKSFKFSNMELTIYFLKMASMLQRERDVSELLLQYLNKLMADSPQLIKTVRESQYFVDVLKLCSIQTFSKETSWFGSFFFLQKAAPVACVIEYIEIAKNNRFNSTASQRQTFLFERDAIEKIIHKNSSVLNDKIPDQDVSGPEYWSQWERANSRIINSFMSLPETNNPSIIKEMIGTID